MGREIITISVPSDSRVLGILNAWKSDPQANVSANVCASIDANGDLVSKLRATEAKFDELLRMLGRRRTKALTNEEWEERYQWRLEDEF